MSGWRSECQVKSGVTVSRSLSRTVSHCLALSRRASAACACAALRRARFVWVQCFRDQQRSWDFPIWVWTDEKDCLDIGQHGKTMKNDEIDEIIWSHRQAWRSSPSHEDSGGSAAFRWSSWSRCLVAPMALHALHSAAVSCTSIQPISSQYILYMDINHIYISCIDNVYYII